MTICEILEGLDETTPFGKALGDAVRKISKTSTNKPIENIVYSPLVNINRFKNITNNKTFVNTLEKEAKGLVAYNKDLTMEEAMKIALKDVKREGLAKHLYSSVKSTEFKDHLVATGKFDEANIEEVKNWGPRYIEYSDGENYAGLFPGDVEGEYIIDISGAREGTGTGGAFTQAAYDWAAANGKVITTRGLSDRNAQKVGLQQISSILKTGKIHHIVPEASQAVDVAAFERTNDIKEAITILASPYKYMKLDNTLFGKNSKAMVVALKNFLSTKDMKTLRDTTFYGSGISLLLDDVND